MSQDDHSQARGSQRNRPEHVGELATQVLSALRDQQVVCADGVRRFALDHLVRSIRSQTLFDPVLILEEMRGHRLTLDAIIDLYIPHACRAVGESWVADDASFADVTIGALRLQALLSEASGQMRIDLAPDENRLHTLIVLPKGEQHFLGVSVVSAQLRRMGCEVSTSFDEHLECLQTRIQEERPDLVMISCARRETLGAVIETVQAIRKASVTGRVIALGGAVLDDVKNLKERTGVDIVASTAKEAVAVFSKHGRVPRSR